MADQFAQFGGRQLASGGQQPAPNSAGGQPPAVPQVDPFQEFGGQKDVTPKSDPFAQFGGEQEPDGDYAKVRGIIDRSFWAAPLVESETTTDQELEAIARQHGIDPETVKGMSTFGGALREDGKRNTWEELQSSVARGVGFNIPQFVGKKSLDDPNLRKAFDDIQDLADAKRSFARGLVENLVPTGAVAKAVTRGAAKGTEKLAVGQAIKQGVREGAAMGGAYGVARSREGEEVRSGVIGAGGGAVLGAGAAAAAEYIPRVFRRNPTKLEQKAIQEAEVDVGRISQELSERTSKSERILEEAVLMDRPLTVDDINRIVDEQIAPDTLRKYTEPLSEENEIFRKHMTETSRQRGDISAELGEVTKSYREVQEQLADLVPADKFQLRNELDQAFNRIERETKAITGLSNRRDQLYNSLNRRTSESTRAGIRKTIDKLEDDLLQRTFSLDGLMQKQDGLQQRIRTTMAAEKLTPTFEKLERSKDRLSAALASIRDPEAPLTDNLIRTGLANEIVESRMMQFAREISGDTPASIEEARALIHQARSQGSQYAQSRYHGMADRIKFAKASEELGLRQAHKTGMGGMAVNALSDSQFPMRYIDHRFNAGAEKALEDLSIGRNIMTYVKGQTRKELDAINKLAIETGTDRTIRDSDRVVRAIENPGKIKIDPKDQAVVNKFRAGIEAIRQHANSTKQVLPTNIQKIEDYVTRVALPKAEMAAAIEKKLRVAIEEASQLLGRPVRDLSSLNTAELKLLQEASPAVRDLVAFHKWRGQSIEGPTDGAKLLASIKDVLHGEPSTTDSLERISRATMSRTDQPIPDFVREWNLYNIWDRYAHDVLSAVYQREPLDRLRNIADKLERVQAVPEAKFVRRVISDALGIRPGTPANMMSRARQEMASLLDDRIRQAVQRGDRVTAGALRSAKSITELPSFLGRQIYSNVLGWYNPRPPIQNLVSGFARTAPELGTKYGYGTYVRGLVWSVMNKSAAMAETKRLGLLPDEFVRTGERALAEGIRATNIGNLTAEGLEQAGRLGMAMYRWSENLNRASIVGTARMMADDLIKGKQPALDSLKRFAPYVQQEVATALANKDAQGAYEPIVKYLNRVTAFNYDRPSMYELGRTLGPVFTTFAKWPTAIGGELLNELRTKGFKQGSIRSLERLGVPFMALAGIDFLIAAQLSKIPESDVYKKFVGESGIKGASPVSSLASFASGNPVFSPPVVDTILHKIVKPALKGDVQSVGRGFDRAAHQYVPMAGALRFFGDDLATYITGDRPEGSTSIGREMTGLEELERKAKAGIK